MRIALFLSPSYLFGQIMEERGEKEEWRNRVICDYYLVYGETKLIRWDSFVCVFALVILGLKCFRILG